MLYGLRDEQKRWSGKHEAREEATARVHEKLRTASEDTGLALKKEGGTEQGDFRRKKASICGGDSEDTGDSAEERQGQEHPHRAGSETNPKGTLGKDI